jgi:hypothetical protein
VLPSRQPTLHDGATCLFLLIFVATLCRSTLPVEATCNFYMCRSHATRYGQEDAQDDGLPEGQAPSASVHAGATRTAVLHFALPPLRCTAVPTHKHHVDNDFIEAPCMFHFWNDDLSTCRGKVPSLVIIKPHLHRRSRSILAVRLSSRQYAPVTRGQTHKYSTFSSSL